MSKKDETAKSKEEPEEELQFDKDFAEKIKTISINPGSMSIREMEGDLDEVVCVMENDGDQMEIIEGTPSGLHEHGYKLRDHDYTIIGPGEHVPVTRGQMYSNYPRKAAGGRVKVKDYDPNKHKPMGRRSYERANAEQRGIREAYASTDKNDVVDGQTKAAFGNRPHVKIDGVNCYPTGGDED